MVNLLNHIVNTSVYCPSWTTSWHKYCVFLRRYGRYLTNILPSSCPAIFNLHNTKGSYHRDGTTVCKSFIMLLVWSCPQNPESSVAISFCIVATEDSQFYNTATRTHTSGNKGTLTLSPISVLRWRVAITLSLFYTNQHDNTKLESPQYQHEGTFW